jgi:dCTP deaminase
MDPLEKPFNTSAVDLRLGDEIVVPKADAPFQLDLRSGGIAQFWSQHSENKTITEEQPFSLKPGKFVLARTKEKVGFPFVEGDFCYSGRVEGRSSLARCGLLVHFTAPTIHAGFEGTITLEIINLGPASFLLIPDMFICQLIIEEVKGFPFNAPNQFSGQSTAVGK